MKRFILLFTMLPLLGSCIENQYYDYDYGYQSQPRARVEVPYYHGHSSQEIIPSSSSQYHGHPSQEMIPSSSSQYHGHPSSIDQRVIVRRERVQRHHHFHAENNHHGHQKFNRPVIVTPSNEHAHPSTNSVQLHQHQSENGSILQNGLSPERNNTHGHD